MVIKTEVCAFSDYRIYPGHGVRFIRRDGQVSEAMPRSCVTHLTRALQFSDGACWVSRDRRRENTRQGWLLVGAVAVSCMINGSISCHSGARMKELQRTCLVVMLAFGIGDWKSGAGSFVGMIPNHNRLLLVRHTSSIFGWPLLSGSHRRGLVVVSSVLWPYLWWLLRLLNPASLSSVSLMVLLASVAVLVCVMLLLLGCASRCSPSPSSLLSARAC